MVTFTNLISQPYLTAFPTPKAHWLPCQVKVVLVQRWEQRLSQSCKKKTACPNQCMNASVWLSYTLWKHTQGKSKLTDLKVAPRFQEQIVTHFFNPRARKHLRTGKILTVHPVQHSHPSPQQSTTSAPQIASVYLERALKPLKPLNHSRKKQIQLRPALKPNCCENLETKSCVFVDHSSKIQQRHKL